MVSFYPIIYPFSVYTVINRCVSYISVLNEEVNSSGFMHSLLAKVLNPPSPLPYSLKTTQTTKRNMYKNNQFFIFIL